MPIHNKLQTSQPFLAQVHNWNMYNRNFYDLNFNTSSCFLLTKFSFLRSFLLIRDNGVSHVPVLSPRDGGGIDYRLMSWIWRPDTTAFDTSLPVLYCVLCANKRQLLLSPHLPLTPRPLHISCSPVSWTPWCWQSCPLHRHMRLTQLCY